MTELAYGHGLATPPVGVRLHDIDLLPDIDYAEALLILADYASSAFAARSTRLAPVRAVLGSVRLDRHRPSSARNAESPHGQVRCSLRGRARALGAPG
jgi:hypothetical protein